MEIVVSFGTPSNESLHKPSRMLPKSMGDGTTSELLGADAGVDVEQLDKASDPRSIKEEAIRAGFFMTIYRK
jgi:hypothetical protein